jgi:hypothetical protein
MGALDRRAHPELLGFSLSEQKQIFSQENPHELTLKQISLLAPPFSSVSIIPLILHASSMTKPNT